MNQVFKGIYIFFVFGLLAFPFSFTLAQSSQMLSVTPPLFQLSVAPGDIWQSSIKVVNGNQHELTVFTEVVNFSPQGERGQAKFTSIPDGDDSQTTFASWIDIPTGPYVIPPQQTREISFFVEVPEHAAPGGHFAAILVGTQPPRSEGSLGVMTSQVVSSLFFARIEGDIVEDGLIREFRTQNQFNQRPETELILRFENKGNVHLQPRGNIVITNMWGKERGVIPINDNTHYGNVLPESIRQFNFSWEGESAITEIGRYKAEATLGYGQDGVKNAAASTYFWVVPVKATLITVGSVVLFIILITWAIKLYVRRMLYLAGVDVDPRIQTEAKKQQPGDVRISRYEKMSAPIRFGAKELKGELQKGRRVFDYLRIYYDFMKRYRLFFGLSLVILIGLFLLALFVFDASKEQRNYEVTIDRGDVQETVNSEEVIKESLSVGTDQPVNTEQHFELVLINESGAAGVAANAAIDLEEAGYRVTSLETNLEASRPKTIIVYDESLQQEALALSATFDGALLSALPGEVATSSEEATEIRIFFGEDMAKN